MSETSFFLRDRSLTLLVLAALCAFLYAYRLGARDFETTDEARRALVVRNMVESGDYAIPELSGHNYLRKPPLYYWLAALSQKVSGSRDEWVYRLPSALAATGSVIVLFLMTERLLTRRAALLASVMLATCALYMVYGTRAGIDMTLGFLVTASMYCLARARDGGWRGWAAWGFWALLGAAFLTKGPVAMLFPLAAALALAAGPGFGAEVRRMRPAAGMLLALAIIVPWGAAILDRIGTDGAMALMREEVLGGFRDDAVRHGKPLLFYLYETPAQFLPWSLFIPAGIMALRERKSPRERGALRFAGAWLLPALIVFSVSHQKRAYYVLPVFGALAIWIGWTVDRFLMSPPADGERPIVRRLARWAFAALTVLVALGALAGGAYLRANQPALFAAAGISLAAAAFWALFGLVSLRRGRPGQAIAAVAACAILYAATARGPVAEWFNRRHSPRLVALTIARAVPPDAELLSLFRSELFIEAYLGRPVERIDRDRELRRRLAGENRVYVLMDRRLYRQRRSLFRRVVLPSIGSPDERIELLLASN